MIGALTRLGLRSANTATSNYRWIWTARVVCCDEITSGDILCEIQTDKAVVALETDEEGVLAKILVQENVPNIKVGHLIAVIATPDEDWKKVAESVEIPAPLQETSPVVEAAGDLQSTAVPAAHQATDAQISMGPAVRLLLQTYGLDASKISATGPHGQLLKGDVLAFHQQQLSTGGHSCQAASVSSPVESVAAASAPPGTPDRQTQPPSFVDIPLTSMRKTIAKRLSHSKSSIPHEYVRGVTWLDRVNLLRQEVKAATGIKLSVNDFIIKACAHALRMVPEMNALSNETTGGISVQPTVDICMAVATPSGLITPILWKADRTPITEVAANAVALAKKARDGKLQPYEFQGGNFTISNLGMFGIREFTAIINPPQVAILAVGTGVTRAIPTGVNTDKLGFGNRMTLTLSVDSRYVDGTTAGHFLSTVSKLLADYPNILLSGDPRLEHYDKKGTQNLTADAFDLAMINAATSAPMQKPTKAA